ncbi:MAG TPA: hypothetical protein VGH67_10545 [Solirubrobacteraceae bacterium]
MQLVEGMGADPDGQEEGGERRAETVGMDDRRRRRAQCDVAEMPGGIGRVQERDQVTPAARCQGVEGRPLQPRLLRRRGRF